VKRWIALLLTGLVVLAVLWNRRPDDALTSSAASPVECVERMFQSAAAGRVADYLDCFAAIHRERLEQEFARKSPAEASQALRQSVADLKGWALLDPPGADAGPRCELTVEWVFASRVDRQRLVLGEEREGWKIVQVENVRPGQAAIPYGTPVFAPIPARTVPSSGP
jgi:hypothetical protein